MWNEIKWEAEKIKRNEIWNEILKKMKKKEIKEEPP